jgi:hypothetical protein
LTTDRTARWVESNRGKPLSEAQLARLLQPFDIYPASCGRDRAYYLAHCQDAFARYLPRNHVDETVNNDRPKSRF